MSVLKKVLMISGVVFFVVTTIGIVLVIYLNTNFLQSQIILACDPDGTDIDFNLLISKRDNSVQWQGSSNDTEKILKSISDSSLQMTWTSEDDEDIVFTLNRLTGKFNLDVEGRTSRLYGRCYEATPKF